LNIGIFQDFEARVLGLHGQAEERDFNALADNLLRLDTESDDPITIYFSCAGGNLIEVLKLIDVLIALRSPTVGIGLGLIQNAGAVILAATTTPMMLPSAILFPSRLWDLPSQQIRVGLHSSESTSIQTLLHRRLDELDASLPHVVSFVREAEQDSRLITAHRAKQLSLIKKIIKPSVYVPTVKSQYVH
jgi:ATP-dependent protease ClpP protease subunit